MVLFYGIGRDLQRPINLGTSCIPDSIPDGKVLLNRYLWNFFG